MGLSELRSLVRRYVDGEVAYDEFRSEFVPQYLSVRHEDVRIEQDVCAIERDCSDYDEGDISEQELREYLSEVATAPIITVRDAPQSTESFSANNAA